jgi:hypothetical protein
MRESTKALTGLIAAIGLAFYVGAKFHYFARFDPYDVSGYVAQHSFFWLGMIVTATVLWLVAHFARRR